MNEAARANFQRVAAAMPALASLPPALQDEVERNLTLLRQPAGTILFRENEGCQGFPIVLAGRVRITRQLDNGREFLMYEVEPGESCVMSTGCLLGNLSYGARGQCLDEVELALIPRQTFDRLISEHRPFREEIFSLFNERLWRLMELVEAVGFQRLDQRLAATLLGRGQRVEHSHEQLARILGVSRESVSRQLKHFEDEAWVKLGRGAIDILDPRALREVAAHGSERAHSVSAVTDAAAARP
jgi:CRP/FNR family transcriptional regulator